MFDVALDNEIMEKGKNGGTSKGKRQRRESTDQSKAKRAKKDAKYGHGGKKRFSKSGDAISSGDMSEFSQKKNNAQFGARKAGGKKGGKPSRPGKSKRAARR